MTTGAIMAERAFVLFGSPPFRPSSPEDVQQSGCETLEQNACTDTLSNQSPICHEQAWPSRSAAGGAKDVGALSDIHVPISTWRSQSEHNGRADDVQQSGCETLEQNACTDTLSNQSPICHEQAWPSRSAAGGAKDVGALSDIHVPISTWKSQSEHNGRAEDVQQSRCETLEQNACTDTSTNQSPKCHEQAWLMQQVGVLQHQQQHQQAEQQHPSLNLFVGAGDDINGFRKRARLATEAGHSCSRVFSSMGPARV